MLGQQMRGLIIQLPRGRHFRIWNNGCEYGWKTGGRVWFFYWHPHSVREREARKLL